MRPPTCHPTSSRTCRSNTRPTSGPICPGACPIRRARRATAPTTIATAWSTRINRAIPCPNGGNRVCVGGAYSVCPTRCDVCVPGSKRTCITSFCTFWGNQACAADGQSFSACKESEAPPPCRAIAQKMMRSRELELCCIENDYCCVDEFDINNNGDHTEMLGRCEAVVCH